MQTVKFLRYDCIIQKGRYSNGRLALELIEKETGEPICVATVNLPHVPLEKDEIIIKDYSENQGIADVLTAAGIVKPIHKVPTGYVYGTVCQLLVNEHDLHESF